jgi:phage I-like protein
MNNMLGGVEMIACDLREVPKAPGRAMICPWGQVKSRSGNFVFNEESARATQEHFRQHGVELPIDYEHQSLGGQFSSANGLAPAAGWISTLHARPGEGLYADITWTPQGARSVYGREYRYFSPVVMVRKADKVAVGLHSVALTNKPAIAQMKPILNKEVVPVPPQRKKMRVPTNRLILFRYGINKLDDGQNYISFVRDCERVVAALFPKAGVPIDVEHGLGMIGQPGYEDMPATYCGDVIKLEFVPNGDSGLVYGHVNWRSVGMDLVANKGFEHISPCVHVLDDHRIVGLDSVALTKSPRMNLHKLYNIVEEV